MTKIKIQIKTIIGGILFEHEKEENTVKETVREMLKHFAGKIIRGALLEGYDLDGVDFSGSSFDNSSFDNSSFDNSRFYNSSFYNSSFYNSSFYNSSFDNSRFYNSSFYNSSFDNSSFYNSRFYNSRFYNSRFYNSSFDNSRFYNSSFDNSSFDNSRFYNSRFDNSRFDNSSFDNATVEAIRKAGQLFMFDSYKHDLWAVLVKAIPEISGLKQSIIDGKINGSVYEGACCCLKGTIANIRGCKYDQLDGLRPDSNSPAECWFMLLREGMNPENSELAKLTLQWIEEFESYIHPKPQPEPAPAQ